LLNKPYFPVQKTGFLLSIGVARRGGRIQLRELLRLSPWVALRLSHPRRNSVTPTESRRPNKLKQWKHTLVGTTANGMRIFQKRVPKKKTMKTKNKLKALPFDPIEFYAERYPYGIPAVAAIVVAPILYVLAVLTLAI
jgi:hypothetical protein